jgi:hypothetical protein
LQLARLWAVSLSCHLAYMVDISYVQAVQCLSSVLNYVVISALISSIFTQRLHYLKGITFQNHFLHVSPNSMQKFATRKAVVASTISSAITPRPIYCYIYSQSSHPNLPSCLILYHLVWYFFCSFFSLAFSLSLSP